MRTFACVDGTTMYGMPYAPFPPKSGCRFVWFVVVMCEISVDESLRTASLSTGVLNALSAGKTPHPPTFGAVLVVPPPPGGVGTQAAGNSARAAHPKIRMRRSPIGIASASCRSGLEPEVALVLTRAHRIDPEPVERDPPSRTAPAPRLRADARHRRARGCVGGREAVGEVGQRPEGD